jgi:hypothetical protein
VRTIPTTLAALLVMAVLWMPAPASASGHAAGWTEYCPYVMTTHDDPIFYPGQKGASPNHDFFGNTTTDANSTYDSLRGSLSTSCLADPYDTSAYWTPMLWLNGKPVQAKTMFEYYWAPRVNAPSEVVSIPKGLKMYGDRVYWTCGGGGGTSPEFGVKAPRKKVPFDCTPWPGSRVTAYVHMPNCWNGVDLDSPDHMSHMAYPDPTTGCPKNWKVLPGLYVGVSWYLANGTGATLSTGDISTFRAMFFDAWDPAEMDRLVAVCMNNGKWCGAWTHSGFNKPPVIKAAKIMPTDVHETDTPLAIAVNPHDPDGDPFTLHYQWTADGQKVGTDSATLSPGQFAPGDAVDVTITAKDNQGNWSLPVTSPDSIVDYDVVAPQPSKPGGVLQNVHGGGFGAGENVALHLDGQSGAVLATVPTDAVGAFSNTDIQMPQNISGGTHWLYGVGANSHIVGKGPFTINAMGSLTPGSLAVGDGATFSGSGFVSNEAVTLTFPNTPPQQTSADGDGMVDDALVAPAEPGPTQTLTVASSGGSFDLTYHVTPTLDIPASGEPGVPMPFSLTGFGAGETVQVSLDGVPTGQTYTSDAVGAVNDQIAFDTTFGQHQVKFTGLTSGATVSTHVALPAFVTLDPTSGPVGTNVIVTSPYGWPHNETVSFYWDQLKRYDLTADGTGSVSTTFTVPAHKVGKVVAKLTDALLGAAPTADFMITTLHYSGGSVPANSPPSITGASIDGAAWTNNTFTGTAHGVKDPDGDPVTLHYSWKVNGKDVGGDTQTYRSSNLQDGDVLGLSIRPEDNHGNWGNSATADPITLKWEVEAADAQPSLASHPVNIYNYKPNETVDMKLDSPTGTTIDTITVNSNGNQIRQQVQMPFPLTGGKHVLYGVGESSGIIGQGPITILPIAYDVPGSMHVGDTTVISASGFKPGEQVTMSFPQQRGVSYTVDNTGSVTEDLVMPEEPFPGGDITVAAPSGTVTAPYKVLSSMTFDSTVAEPRDEVPFQLHGYGPSEQIEGALDGVVTQTYTTSPNGSLYATMSMDAPFGRHRITMTGMSSGEQHNWKMNLLPYVKVTPNPAHAGDTLTITSLYGWVPTKDVVYLYWGKNVVQMLNPDSDGSISTTFQVPTTQKPGVVTLKLLDTLLGKVASCKVTIVS